nr:unnamed protein product [Callosobruchus analis]
MREFWGQLLPQNFTGRHI